MKDLDDFKEKVKKSKSEDGDECRTAQSEVTMEGATTIASEVLAAILKQVTTENAFDVVRRCGKDGVKAYRKLRARVEPQLFGQLANAVVRLGKLTIDAENDPVEQLGAFSDLQSSIQRYGGEHLDARTVEVIVLANAVAAMPQCYSTVVTDIGREAKPSLESLLQQSEYFFINVLQQRPSSTHLHDHAAAATEKPDDKRPICAVCGKRHATTTCWLENSEGLEQYCKKFPDFAKSTRESFARRKKVYDESKDAGEKCAAAMTLTDDEVWNLENLEEVPIACAATTSTAYAHRPACTVDVKAATRVLYYDSMASQGVFNDLSYFENGTVDANTAVTFNIMGGHVTTSLGGGYGFVEVQNLVTKQYDQLRVKAQFVPESPFNLISAGVLEDTYGLYGQLRDRKLVNINGEAQYHLLRSNNVYIVPQAREEWRTSSLKAFNAKWSRS